MSEKIELKEKLAAVDMGFTTLWDEMDDEQRKALKSELFILNRYISNVEGVSTEKQEHFVITTNELYNKNWNLFQSKHPKLLWLSLCQCSFDKSTIFFHKWLGVKKNKSSDSKKVKFLSELYPNAKMTDIELQAHLASDKDIRDLAKIHGFTDEQIKIKLK